MSDNLRFCPNCGTHTEQAFCPADGVATFLSKSADPEAARCQPGDRVAGKYRVTRKLGQGGFGAVYEAEHTGGLGKVALKMLAMADQEQDDIRRFYREAQVTAQLRHANTVRVFDVGQAESGALFIAMELLNGKSLEDELKDLMRNGQVMGCPEAIAMAIDVLKSLSEAHSNGLVHRDLKPANLMLTEVDGDRVVKVLDFGIAHVQGSSLTGTGRALGTPAYMSPEQCTGQALDARSDLYALGVILYRCVAGKTPFADPNPLTIMFAHASQTPIDVRGVARTPVSDAFAEIVMRALAKQPEHRFAHARDMRQALEAARQAPLDAAPPSPAGTVEGATGQATVPAMAGYRRPSTHSPAWTAVSPSASAPSSGVTGNLAVGATVSPRHAATTDRQPLARAHAKFANDAEESDATMSAAVATIAATPSANAALPVLAHPTAAVAEPPADPVQAPKSRAGLAIGLAAVGVIATIAAVVMLQSPPEPPPTAPVAVAPVAAPVAPAPVAPAPLAQPSAQPAVVGLPAVVALPAPPTPALAPAVVAAEPAPVPVAQPQAVPIPPPKTSAKVPKAAQKKADSNLLPD